MEPVSTKVSIDIKTPLEWFFYWFTSMDISRVMHRYWLLPGVTGTKDQTGPMHLAGSSRVLLLSDGTTTNEEIISSNPPNEVIYQILGIENSFRYLVSKAKGELRFREVKAGITNVEWRYSYYGLNRVSTFVLKILIPIFWRGFMRSALNRTKRIAEEEALVKSQS